MGILKKKSKKKYIAVFVVSEKGSYSFVGVKRTAIPQQEHGEERRCSGPEGH